MDLVIGVVGMVVLAGVYVALGLADRGEDACEGCLLRGDVDGGCLACPESPETARRGTPRAERERPAGRGPGNGPRTNGNQSAAPGGVRRRNR